MVVSLDGESCIPQCGKNEKPVNGHCECKESAIPYQSRSGCSARRTCARFINAGTDEETCADLSRCPNERSLEKDGKSCVLVCASKKRAFDKVAGEYVCVDDCKPYALVFDGKDTCVTCATKNILAPVWNASANDCRACETADGGVHWDSADEKCVDECPEAAPVFVEQQSMCRKCEKSYGGEFWDGQKCVEECPLAADAEHVCKPCAEINDKLPFWDAAQRVCVSECPEGFARGRDGAGHRVCVCQRGLLFDTEKNLCVP